MMQPSLFLQLLERLSLDKALLLTFPTPAAAHSFRLGFYRWRNKAGSPPEAHNISLSITGCQLRAFNTDMSAIISTAVPDISVPIPNLSASGSGNGSGSDKPLAIKDEANDLIKKLYR